MAEAPQTTIGSGTVQGTSANGIDRFLGIPYAAPPFGALRYARPVPPGAWDGVRDASQFGATAPQMPYGGGLEKYLPSVQIDGDDILTVNVWRPAERSGPLPVVVWVHGGALTRGTPALDGYDGEPFARHGIVFVSIAYRLGQEGFAVIDGAPANLGVLDQEAALRWVRREIAAFGGDPARVTVMGQSAGANTLTALLALPQAKELFDQAILQSGPMSGQPVKKAGRMSRAIAKRLGIGATREAFAAAEPATLVAAQTAISAGGSPLGGGPTVAIVIEGEAAPVDPLAALRAGAGRDIPVLIGATTEEYRLWFIPSGATEKITKTQLTLARLAARVPRTVIAAHRRRRPDAKPGEILGEVVTDMLLRAPITRFADSRVGTAAPTWVYEFRWQSPVDGLGAAHAMELGFVFDRVDAPDSIALGGADAPQPLADAMHGAWVRFIVGGDPGWEQWSPRQPVEVFDADGGHIEYAPRADELAGLPDR